MMTHSLLTEVIRTDWESIKGFIPCRTATYVGYKAGARTARAWNEGEDPIGIDLPRKDGYYVPDGNPFAIPNGRPSTSDDPEALYLVRHQDSEYSGPVGRGIYHHVGDDERDRVACGIWSVVSGLALVGIQDPKDPKALLQKAAQLRTAATELEKSFGSASSTEDYARLIKPALDEAAFLTELAGKIEALRQKA